MNSPDQDDLMDQFKTLNAEIDALRLLVLTLISQMAIDNPHQIQVVARMVEAAGEAMHSESATEHHRSLAREIDALSRLMRQITSVSQH